MPIKQTTSDSYLEYGVDFDARTIFLHGDVEEDTVKYITKSIIRMGTKDVPIKLYISSYGGDLHEMFGLYDVICNSNCIIETHTIGKSMSAAVLLSACGDKGYRFAGANTMFMLHDSTADLGSGNVDFHEREVKAVKEVNNRWLDLMAKHTKLSSTTLKKMFASKGNEYFWAEKALEYGIIDIIL